MSYMFGGMNVSASRGEYLKDLEKKMATRTSKNTRPAARDGEPVIKPVFVPMNASLEPSSDEEDEGTPGLDEYDPPLGDGLITEDELSAPHTVASKSSMRRAKQRRIWQELMLLTEQYVAVEYFVMDVAVELRDKARKMKVLLKYNEIHDEIHKLVHPDPSAQPQLSEEASAFAFQAIDKAIESAMTELDEVQRKLYALQEEKNTVLQRIIESQDDFHNVSVFHQFDQIRAPQKQLWDQFKKDIVRENIKFTGQCVTMPVNSSSSPSSSSHSSSSLLSDVHCALQDGPLVHRCSGSNFLVFLKSFVAARKYLNAPSIEKLVFGCLPDLIGRTVNAGLPYDVARVLICHPETECLSPALHSDPRKERIKFTIKYHRESGRVECSSRMVSCFRLIPTGGESEIRRLAIETHTTVRIDYSKVDCPVCDNSRTLNVVSQEAKQNRPEDPLLALDISKLPVQFHKTEAKHVCVLDYYEHLKAALPPSVGDDTISLILQFVNPFWFSHLTRVFVLKDL